MNRKLIILLCMSVCVVNGNQDKKLIMLDETNVVTLRGKIDSDTTARFILDIMLIDSPDIYIYLITPGGSVTHGHQIINVINALNQTGKKIYCVGDMVNSMGFSILQSCPIRYIRTNSVLMQHQMSLGLDGPIEQIRARLNFTEQIENTISSLQYERLGMGKIQFNNLINNDWWLYGENALHHNVADELVNVLCSKELLLSNHTKQVTTIMGSFSVTYSDCPIILDPISVNTSNIKNKNEFTKYFEQHKGDYYMSQFV
jgi:ATP-dependent protease ClpP protease subunit